MFERDGFIEARITDIAEEAGAAHGTFYTYFDSKESALRAVILQPESELLGAGAAQYQGRRGGRDPVEALRAANRRYLQTYRANSKLMVIWKNAATKYIRAIATSGSGSLAGVFAGASLRLASVMKTG